MGGQFLPLPLSLQNKTTTCPAWQGFGTRARGRLRVYHLFSWRIFTHFGHENHFELKGWDLFKSGTYKRNQRFILFAENPQSGEGFGNNTAVLFSRMRPETIPKQMLSQHHPVPVYSPKGYLFSQKVTSFFHKCPFFLSLSPTTLGTWTPNSNHPLWITHFLRIPMSMFNTHIEHRREQLFWPIFSCKIQFQLRNTEVEAKKKNPNLKKKPLKHITDNISSDLMRIKQYFI